MCQWSRSKTEDELNLREKMVDIMGVGTMREKGHRPINMHICDCIYKNQFLSAQLINEFQFIADY